MPKMGQVLKRAQAMPKATQAFCAVVGPSLQPGAQHQDVPEVKCA